MIGDAWFGVDWRARGASWQRFVELIHFNHVSYNCVALTRGRALVPAPELEPAGFVLPAGAWRFPETYLASLAGELTPLVAAEQAGRRIYPRPAGASTGDPVRLLIGCDGTIGVVGGIYDRTSGQPGNREEPG